MEIIITNETKNRLEFDLAGESHLFCNLIKEELNKDDHVKNVTYVIDHPLISKPHFIIETDTSSNPKKALKDAVKRIKKNNDKLKAEVKKEIK